MVEFDSTICWSMHVFAPNLACNFLQLGAGNNFAGYRSVKLIHRNKPRRELKRERERENRGKEFVFLLPISTIYQSGEGSSGNREARQGGETFRGSI